MSKQKAKIVSNVIMDYNCRNDYSHIMICHKAKLVCLIPLLSLKKTLKDKKYHYNECQTFTFIISVYFKYTVYNVGYGSDIYSFLLANEIELVPYLPS